MNEWMIMLGGTDLSVFLSGQVPSDKGLRSHDLILVVSGAITADQDWRYSSPLHANTPTIKFCWLPFGGSNNSQFPPPQYKIFALVKFCIHDLRPLDSVFLLVVTAHLCFYFSYWLLMLTICYCWNWYLMWFQFCHKVNHLTIANFYTCQFKYIFNCYFYLI